MLPGRCQRDNCSPGGSTDRGYGGRSGRRYYVYITRISTDFCTVAETLGSCNIPETLLVDGAHVVSIPLRFRGRTRREAAAFYLSELAQAILAGEFDVVTEHDTIRVQPGDPVVLEIAVIRKLRVDHVSVQVRWPHRHGGSGPGRSEVRLPRLTG
jgi:amphi-Trp domain-containing protein